MIINLFVSQQYDYHPIDANDMSNYLSKESNRYRHILGVVRLMENLLPSLPIPDDWKPMLIQACYLHDIGYSPKLQRYGFHPLDGAIFAAQQQFAQPIVAAVLFHSCAYEAVKEERNPEMLTIYEKHDSLLTDQDRCFIQLVTYCDIQTSPTGETITFQERLDEIITRYGLDHPVSQMMQKNKSYYEELIRQVHHWIIEKSGDQFRISP